jgi:hypothetical protein
VNPRVSQFIATALAALMVVGGAQAQDSDRTFEVRVRQMAARQLNVDLLVYGLTSQPVPDRNLKAEVQVPEQFPFVRVWSVSTPTVTHWGRYHVAQVGRDTFLGGGFVRPQLPELAGRIRAETGPSGSLVDLAELLLRLGDEAGLATVTPGTLSASGEDARRAWSQRPPSGIKAGSPPKESNPSETVVYVEGIAPREVYGTGGFWVPLAGVFVFDSSGTLATWRVVEGHRYRLSAGK